MESAVLSFYAKTPYVYGLFIDFGVFKHRKSDSRINGSVKNIVFSITFPIHTDWDDHHGKAVRGGRYWQKKGACGRLRPQAPARWESASC
jgi:hypothetical protein